MTPPPAWDWPDGWPSPWTTHPAMVVVAVALLLLIAGVAAASAIARRPRPEPTGRCWQGGGVAHRRDLPA